MSKQLYSQRFILKIQSTKLKKANWSLNINLKTARQNNEIIQLGDSQLLRFIRDINNDNTTEEEIRSIKKEIKDLKKQKTNKKNIENIKNLYDKLDDALFIKDYVTIVFNKKSDFDRACSKKGFEINGVKFKRLLGTTGGVKKNSVNFCSERIYEELNNRLENDYNKKTLIIPAKFEAYKALSASVSNPVTEPEYKDGISRVLVIKDGVTNIKDKVIKISDNGDEGYNVDYNVDYEAEKEFCDGCGMISKQLADKWAIDLGLYYKDDNGNKIIDYTPSGFNTRWSFCKGMVYVFDYKQFAKEVANNYMVEDAWGDMHDIRNIDLILTTNMLKLWNAYDNINDYLEKCHKNGYKLSVSKCCPKKLEKKRNLNYQYLQSYNFTDDDIKDITKETIDNINGALGDNYAKSILYIKGSNITKNNIINSPNDFVKAIMIDKNVLNDSYIKNKIYKMIEKKIKEAKIGVLQVDGNYSIISGDLYALCESMFNMEIHGLLKANEFYNRAWLDNGDKEIVAFRSPMTSHNNIKKMRLVDNDEVRKWFKYMDTVTVFNAWDTSVDAMNGADFDSDAIISTNNKTILNNTKETQSIICEQKSAPKVKITQSLLKKSNKNGFGNDVGTITNRITAMYDVLSTLKPNSDEYNELIKRIMCGQALQQESIDKIKGIKAKEMPKEWYNYKYNKININSDGEILDDDKTLAKKEFNIKLMANKKPYFFIYNYDNLRVKYNSFIKDVKNNSLIRFGKTLDEILDNPVTEEEKMFVKSITYKNPVFEHPSTMNKICWFIENEFKDVKLKVNKEDNFDKSIYKTKKRYNKDIYENIVDLYKKYRKSQKDNLNYMNTSIDNEYVSNDSMDYNANKALFVDIFKQEAEKMCNNAEDLCNIVVDIAYTNKNSRQFAWDICGDQIIKNLLDKNNNTYKFPVKNEYGDISWNGDNYSLVELECDK